MLLPLLLVEEMERRLEWGSGCAEGKKIDEEGDEAVVAEREEMVLGSCGEGKEMVKRRGKGAGK